MPHKHTVQKVVLAYSGGLDTSVILHWLRETYGCEVVTVTADIGQGDECDEALAKAKKLGVREAHLLDLKLEFVRDYVFPMMRANCLYEGVYLLGTSIARPLIAKSQIDIARQTNSDAVAHGATGKGNDQLRFELSYYALAPDITVIAPWREWEFIESRQAHSLTANLISWIFPQASAASRLILWMPICCMFRMKDGCWKIRGRMPMNPCIA